MRLLSAVVVVSCSQPAKSREFESPPGLSLDPTATQTAPCINVENETVVELVDSGVTAILTRLQSEWGTTHNFIRVNAICLSEYLQFVLAGVDKGKEC